MAVQFTDTSYNATGWYWEFGDGITSTDQNPVHLYIIPGVYSVNHESTNAHDFFWTNKSNYINVLSNPVHADFYADITSGNAPLTVHFTDTSTNATTWSWNFGDSNSSSSQNPTHIYSFAGTFTVSLTASNTYSTDTMTKVDYIVVSSPLPPAPVANFTGTPLTGDSPLLVTFTDLSTGTIDSWSWNFGDGNTSTTSSPSHTYAFSGTFDVSLQVTNTGGSDTMTKTGYITVTTDITPPDSITNLTGTPTSSCDGIVWTWTDPTTADFSHILAWLNGVAVGNVSKGVQRITLSGLGANTTYQVSSKTVDTHGNVNATFVNASATTNSMNCTAPSTGSKVIFVQSDSDLPLPPYIPIFAIAIGMGMIIMHKRQRKE
jgi:PKD repeat protein